MTPGPCRPFGCLVLQSVLLWAAATVVDVGGLTPDGSWPSLFAAASLTIAWSSWGLGTTLVPGLVARLATDPDVVRGATWFAAVAAAPFGVLGILAGAVWLVGSGHVAEVLMAIALLAGGALPLLPLVGLARARRTA